MGRELPNDYAIDALTAEVERRKAGQEAHRYSYGRLVADTTLGEREVIAENYRRRVLKAPSSKGKYIEPDDEKDRPKVGRSKLSIEE